MTVRSAALDPVTDAALQAYAQSQNIKMSMAIRRAISAGLRALGKQGLSGRAVERNEAFNEARNEAIVIITKALKEKLK